VRQTDAVGSSLALGALYPPSGRKLTSSGSYHSARYRICSDCSVIQGKAEAVHLNREERPQVPPAARGLCQSCAQFNWPYHLNRYVKGLERDNFFWDEDALVKQILQSDKPAYTEPSHVQLAYPDTAIWYSIKDAPYCGSYFMNKSGSYTYFDLVSLQCPYIHLLRLHHLALVAVENAQIVDRVEG
jgi:hypothetical protein